MTKNKGVLVSSPIRPISGSMSIATALQSEIKGGFHSVSDSSERDNIPVDRREFGMLVYLTSADEFYQLTQVTSDLSDNNNWILVNLNPNIQSTEWLDSVITITSSPPATYSVGSRYLISVGSGAWIGRSDEIAEWVGSWEFTSPTQSMTIRIDDVPNSLYCYLNGSWVKQDFVGDPFFPRFEVPFSETINVGTGSQYLIYGKLNSNGQINNWGQVIVINGATNGNINNYGTGSTQEIELLTDVYSGVGISVSTTTFSTRNLALNINGGTGISLSYLGNQIIINSDVSSEDILPKWRIESGQTIHVPNYNEYLIYGDLEVAGNLDIATFGKVVVMNGSFSVTGTVSNSGNVELYNLLTTSDLENYIEIGSTEIRSANPGRILFESTPIYLPSLGITSSVVTDSSNLVFKTSSSWLTSTASSGFTPYLGVGVDDPLKRVHIRNSGILIDGSEAEQESSLGDPNSARFVINSSTSDTQRYFDVRNIQGSVLHLSGGIQSGNRFPSLSIGTTSGSFVFNAFGYYSGQEWFSIDRLGRINIGTISASTYSIPLLGIDSGLVKSLNPDLSLFNNDVGYLTASGVSNQIESKFLLYSDFSTYSITGTVSSEIMGSVKIPANTINQNCLIKIKSVVDRDVTGDPFNHRLLISTSSSLIGSTQISSFSQETDSYSSFGERSFKAGSSYLFGMNSEVSSSSDFSSITGSASIPSTFTTDWTLDQWILTIVDNSFSETTRHSYTTVEILFT